MLFSSPIVAIASVLRNNMARVVWNHLALRSHAS
jgi:hypothetical protein